MPPLGMLYVASYLEKHGIKVSVADPFSDGEDPGKIFSDIVGITCMSSQWSRVKEIARDIKINNPNSTIIVGGVHPTVAANEVAADKDIDIAVVGEGEKAILRIVEDGIKSGIAYGEPIANLDERPFPARHLINMKKYTARDNVVPFHWIKATTIMTSVGCQFNCIFCINSKGAMFGRQVRYNSPEYVEREVEELVSTYGVDGLFFQDDNFLTDKRRAIEICKKIKPFDLIWLCASRVDTLDEELLLSMKNAGCGGINFGVESGSPKVLRALNKRTSIEAAIKSFDLCRKHGVKTYALIMIGNPEETMEDIKLTDKLLERMKPDFIQIGYCSPYKGTVLYDMALEKGWLQEGVSFRTDEPQMEVNFTLRELAEIGENLEHKYIPFLKMVKPYLNKYFIYDMLRVLRRKPSLVFNGVDKWKEASRMYL